MKRFFLFFVLLLCLPSLSFGENVSKMTMTLHFPFGYRVGSYTGTVKDGKPEGYGCFESENSSGTSWIYVGDFANGTFHGNGRTTWFAVPTFEAGTYKNGVLVEGIILSGDYAIEGTFSDSQTITGKGKIYDSSLNLIFDGTFENSILMEGTLYDVKTGEAAITGTFGEGFKTFILNNYIRGYWYY